MKNNRRPVQQGLYHPEFEHDACGVGFVCHIKGRASHAMVQQGLEVLKSLAHRGATGADPKTGDGAGILIQMPHVFFAKAAQKNKIDLPQAGFYGTGLIFLPRQAQERRVCKDVFARIIKQEGQVLLGWRRVPVDNSDIGVTAKETEPVIEQVFIARNSKIKEELDFERCLYIIRKKIENTIRSSAFKQKSFFYITNLSCRTFVYKGLLMPYQLENFFVDFKDKDVQSALCLVHSRYSTNTFPTWDLSQPFRFLAHNGEINTLRGNINWMKAREGLLESKFFGKELKKIFPIIVSGGSDSAMLDNTLELLMLSGRSLAHAMMMLIPAAWEQNHSMQASLKDFYKFHMCMQEPWDGPAAVAFTDGTRIGAILDRNGLRPARYLITKNDIVVMASEVGVLDIAATDIAHSGRLEPGKMLFIDTQRGAIVQDEELKQTISQAKPYGTWLKEGMVELSSIPDAKEEKFSSLDILTHLKAFGFSREDLKTIIKPMADKGTEPVGSMGSDTPHALLSEKPQLLYSYFKQLFAQVTNPPIDPIREELVMSLETYLGPEKNLLEESPGHSHRLRIQRPVLTNDELRKLKHIRQNGFKAKVIPIVFKANDEKDMVDTLKDICLEATKALKSGTTFIILSDRGVDEKHAAIPALLATATVHHHLVAQSLRTQISLIVESAEPREVHHFALLFGYGADCINPYLAYQAVQFLVRHKELEGDEATALKNYRKAIDKGILKILSKMGISTLQSYRGAQIFEALGLDPKVIEKSFPGTVSRIGGAGFTTIAREAILRHQEAFGQKESNAPLNSGGVYQWKRDGEFHLWSPESISALQQASRLNDVKKYKEFAKLINEQAAHPTTLRGLLKFKKSKPVPLSKVESVDEIVRRFVTGAMSFGSISKEAHETIAIAMNRLKGRSNTGEGGEDPARFMPLPNGDSARSSVKQVASGRFGVTTNYLVHADELQIKIAQGAKPGEGGQLPGHKVSVTIAKTRYTTPGVTLISPPPHHDIYSIEDLAQLIFDLKNVNPKARISVKLVSEIGVGTIAAGVAKGHADMILISGGDGGTGASPLSSIKNAGLPWELGISETHQTLLLNDLRSRVRLQTDGQMRTGRDVAIAALLGAEEYGFCTAVLIVMGCVMLRHCNLNNCSVGIATQDDLLRQRFAGRPEYITNYLKFVAEELREIMSSLGVKKINDLIGRTDLLEVQDDILPWKAEKIDFSKILYKPKVPKTFGVYANQPQHHAIDNILDLKLIALSQKALKESKPVEIERSIKNTDRTAGAMLSGEVCRVFGEIGLPEDTICCRLKGVAGQSFGAWLARGVTFELEGMANDYVGKGISGGKIIIFPDKRVTYKAQENILIGNTAFYGAIAGEAYIRGVAGERFCIRNSGLLAVVEGLGDHGCEYMTGGVVVVIGTTGRNFAAGMSGGVAYVYNEEKNFSDKCNMEMVGLEGINEEDKHTIVRLLNRHVILTKSPLAKKILDNFSQDFKKFIKVMPKEYKRILEAKKQEEKLNLLEESDG
jgi:glutamate synthase domain-containing protein 2/glutamate synthase domain-containing protein 1/glutamate synthase domain-containing protein 3